MAVDSAHQIWRLVKKALSGNPRLLGLIRRAGWAVEARKYARMAASVVTEPRTVLFECYLGKAYACSPKTLYEAMLDDGRFDDFELIWAFDDAFDEGTEPRLARAEVVRERSNEYHRALARAGTIISNELLPAYVSLKRDQVYVQTWHGTPFKRIGAEIEVEAADATSTKRDTIERMRRDAKKQTYLISPSAFTSQHLCDSFLVDPARRPQMVLELGYPRNDALALAKGDRAARDAACEALGIPRDKRVLLFAPTWREDQYRSGVGFVYQNTLDLDCLRRQLGDEWVVLMRTHQNVASPVDLGDFGGFAYDVSSLGDVNLACIAADALLTDYSSVMFDYANLRRPIVLYVPDLDHYAHDLRGFTCGIDEIPAPVCMTTEEVAAAIGALDGYWDSYGARYDRFVETFCPHDDGHAAQRVLDRLF